MACDSTCQLLPDNEETRKIGIHKNQYKEVASVKISVYYDISSKLITLAALYDKRTSDLVCCLGNQLSKIPKNVISVYDRAYGSQILVFFHELYQSKFVVRLKLDFSNTVKKFVQSADNEVYITEQMTERAYKRLETFGIRKSKQDMVSYRLVKVMLATGEMEILMTNLDKTFTVSDLAELYRQRWGIETCFFCLKSFQMLGCFSGYSALSVKQDIYINLIFYNLQTILQIEADKQVKELSKKRQNQSCKNKKSQNEGYKVNRNVGINTVRMYMKDLFLLGESEFINILDKMTELFLQSLEIVKEKSKERVGKMLRQNERHHTEKNYKRGF